MFGKLKVGDKVKIIKKIESWKGKQYLFGELIETYERFWGDRDKYLGKTGTIEYIQIYGKEAYVNFTSKPLNHFIPGNSTYSNEDWFPLKSLRKIK